MNPELYSGGPVWSPLLVVSLSHSEARGSSTRRVISEFGRYLKTAPFIHPTAGAARKEVEDE